MAKRVAERSVYLGRHLLYHVFLALHLERRRVKRYWLLLLRIVILTLDR